MALKNYGVLKGHPTEILNSWNANNHVQVQIDPGSAGFHRIAVNVRSKLTPKDLQYYLDADYQHPILTKLKQLPFGFTELERKEGGGALDYVRNNLFPVEKLQIIPDRQDGPHNDLNDLFDLYLQKAIQQRAVVYAFGEKWGPEKAADKYFDFKPGNGIHDIHMNQGSTGKYRSTNGTWQDGGFFIHFEAENKWLALFLKFQSQYMPTDAQGHPVVREPQAVKGVKILAALVNPKNQNGNEQGMEKILLFNPTDQPLNIDNWAILDKQFNRELLNGIIVPGEPKVITLNGRTAVLSNKGGIITLLDDKGIKVHGVSYTESMADVESEWILFS